MLKYISDVESAPAAIGPYSQAVEGGGLIFLSGQIPIDPTAGKLIEGGVREQARQVMKNLSALLEHLGLNFSNVLKSTIYMQDMSDFAAVNEVYAEALGETRPARATVAVAGLPLGAKVEIEMIAQR